MSEYFDQDQSNPEYHLLAEQIAVREAVPRATPIANMYCDEDLPRVLETKISSEIIGAFAEVARTEKHPIKAIAWNKKGKRRLVFQLNHFDRLVDSYLARKL